MGLQADIKVLKDCAWDETRQEELDPAIAFLEAAEKFMVDDIQRLLRIAEARLPEYFPLPGYVCPGKMLKDKLRALLEALPDKE